MAEKTQEDLMAAKERYRTALDKFLATSEQVGVAVGVNVDYQRYINDRLDQAQDEQWSPATFNYNAAYVDEYKKCKHDPDRTQKLEELDRHLAEWEVNVNMTGDERWPFREKQLHGKGDLSAEELDAYNTMWKKDAETGKQIRKEFVDQKKAKGMTSDQDIDREWQTFAKDKELNTADSDKLNGILTGLQEQNRQRAAAAQPAADTPAASTTAEPPAEGSQAAPVRSPEEKGFKETARKLAMIKGITRESDIQRFVNDQYKACAEKENGDWFEENERLKQECFKEQAVKLAAAKGITDSTKVEIFVNDKYNGEAQAKGSWEDATTQLRKETEGEQRKRSAGAPATAAEAAPPSEPGAGPAAAESPKTAAPPPSGTEPPKAGASPTMGGRGAGDTAVFDVGTESPGAAQTDNPLLKLIGEVFESMFGGVVSLLTLIGGLFSGAANAGPVDHQARGGVLAPDRQPRGPTQTNLDGPHTIMVDETLCALKNRDGKAAAAALQTYDGSLEAAIRRKGSDATQLERARVRHEAAAGMLQKMGPEQIDDLLCTKIAGEETVGAWLASGDKQRRRVAVTWIVNHEANAANTAAQAAAGRQHGKNGIGAANSADRGQAAVPPAAAALMDAAAVQGASR